MTTMESLIGLVNRIQRACTVLGDHGGADGALPTLWEALPSVAVVGGQSSGKSSVLESIVGRDFLPRGSGIVTRRPLVLQLHKTEEGQPEYAEFLHLPKRKFTDFSLVRKEIQDETDRLTGKTKQISPVPIHLSIYSPFVVNLTLIDLPGLTKVAVEGQPDSIVQDIENMVRLYVEKPNCIILAISPANQDIATSDAIKIAREVDPTGERTFGVLTKLDLMDKGTNALDVLEGRSYKLQHPWVGIVNRSQADINKNVDMIVARRKEREYFANSPDYSHLASKMGSEYLAKLLSRHLESVIRARIPSISSLITKTIDELESEMDHLGRPIALDAGAQLYTILELCRAFDKIFKEHLEGGRPGGDRIYGVFDNQLPVALKKLPFDRHLSLQNVKKVVSEADGYQPHLIAPEQGYRRLIESSLNYFRGPAEASVDAVHFVLKELVRKSIGETQELKRFPTLQAELAAASYQALEKFREDSRKTVIRLVDMEASYLTVDFFRKLPQEVEKAGNPATPTIDRYTDGHFRRIASNVSSYIFMVSETLKNSIPKAAVYCQVREAKRSLLNHFYTQVGKKEGKQLSQLLDEDPALMERRLQCAKRLELYKNARDEIDARSVEYVGLVLEVSSFRRLCLVLGISILELCGEPAMAGSADGFVVWKDFPRGLNILLLDRDAPSAVETKSKLEGMDYTVSLYHNEEDALEAISKEAESFHVAIVEVTTSDNCGSFRFLEMAKGIPTIVISDVHCLSTMMKCIALGAAEFLQKPVSEDKLRNIWQHVVHKAFNAGVNELSKSLKPVKDTVVSMLRKQSETDEHKIKQEESERDDKYGCEKTMANDRFSAPSTPQLEQGGRFPTNGEFQETTHRSIAKELPQPRKHAEEEVNSVDDSKTDECSAVKEGFLPSHYHSVDDLQKTRLTHSDGARNNRMKMKVDWTPELHRQFVQAVEQLGIDQAIPSKIVKLMKVEGLTRHSVASHLQKYRMHRRHVLPKDEDRRWQAHKDPTQRGYIPRPIWAYPPNHPNCGAPTNQIYPFWVHPNCHTHGVQVWGQAGDTRWHPPPQSWPRKTYPMVHADAWGCPVFVAQYGQYPMSSPMAQLQRSLMYSDFDTSIDSNEMFQESYGLHQVEEAIDRFIKDVTSKPWLPPLPLGLKSPSAEMVLAELHRHGICTPLY
ncbi:hypothetical protein OPV22_027154 [Ensete ventricosum]|uniref:HTH myb-type domain-containing protein n=2 Tax=Magnoliopsida TaxID=3398 RepID=A0AAV8PUX0_ENSVE|nr:hypothetical protein OPV22_027154 [Ensete ventricosum]